MIEFDYRIVRDEGDEKRTYLPTIPKTIHDLTCIEGPNSSGKSTLLHILAIGLFGLKNRNIKDSLQRKLKDLSGSGHQEVTFSFSIKNDQNRLQLFAEKKNPVSQELAVYETVDGRRSPLTPETFERKYNLIYDIPDNPLERLDELTRELKDRQAVIGRRVEELKIYLRDTVKEVQGSRDPNKLEEFRRNLKMLTTTVDGLAIERTNLESDLLLIKKYYSSKFYLEYRTQFQQIRSKVDALEGELKGIEKEERALKRRTKTLTKDAKALIEAIRSDLGEITFSLRVMNLKTKDDFVEVWRDLDLERTLVRRENHYIIFNGTKAFRDKLKDLERALQDDGRLDEARFLGELIGLLKHYSNVKTTLPGVDKTIPEFIALLERRFKECKDIKALHEKYEGLLAKLDTLEESSHRFIDRYLPELADVLKEQQNHKEEAVDDVQEKVARLIGELGRTEKRVEYFRDEAIRSGVKESEVEYVVTDFESHEHLRPFASYDEKQFEEKLRDLQKIIDTTTQRIKEYTHHKMRTEHEIDRLERQEPHKYQDRADELQALFNVVQRLEQRLVVEFDDNLKRLMGKNLKKSDLSKNQISYFDAVAIYLGQRVRVIRHIDQDYPVKRIDLIERRVLTDSGKIIVLTDLGTGQGQSAYLKTLLRSNDRRKMIALIDEVAMMDTQSMKPIFEQLRRKYDDGSLLAAIVVQRGESLTVTPIP